MPWVEPIVRRAAWITIAAAIVAFLALADEVVIPVALSALLAFALMPIVRWLQSLLRSHTLSVVLAYGVGLLLCLGIAAAALFQFFDFADELPGYRQTIATKLITIRGTSDGVVGRFLRAMGDIESDVEQGLPDEERAMNIPAIPVVAKEEQRGFFRTTMLALEPYVHPLVTAGVVALLVFLLLLYGQDIRDRVVVLAGTHQISVTAQALEDATHRIGRYLLMQAAINAGYGAALALGLALIGLPNALLLGLLAGVLRFVPLLGPWLGAVVPILLSMAVFDHWWGLIMVAGLFLALEAVLNFALEPWLYGHSTGISSAAVIVAILFWTWVWGPIGLLLAMPITVCLVVLGKYIEPLRVFYILLSDEPMLSGDRRLYHRLMTGDFESASQMVRQALADEPIPTVCDDLLLPVLAAARADHAAGRLSADRLALVTDTLEDLVTGGDEPSATLRAPRAGIACAPARGSDRSATLLVAATLAQSVGRVIPMFESSLASDLVTRLDEEGTSVLALISTDADSTARARLLAKTLLNRVPRLRLVMATLGAEAAVARAPLENVYLADSVRALVDKLREEAHSETARGLQGAEPLPA